MSIRHWPEGERPREKLLARGSATLSDAELLAVLLGSGSSGKDAIALGRELLASAGSLDALLGRPEHSLRIVGLGPAKRARIIATLELARRSLAEQLQQRPSLGSPRDSGDYLRAQLRHLPYEVFGCLFLVKSSLACYKGPKLGSAQTWPGCYRCACYFRQKTFRSEGSLLSATLCSSLAKWSCIKQPTIS
jgi:DNA repair protein RadC